MEKLTLQVTHCQLVGCKLLQVWTFEKTRKLGVGYASFLIRSNLYYVPSSKFFYFNLPFIFAYSWEGQVHLHCWIFPHCFPRIHSACCWACSCQQEGMIHVRESGEIISDFVLLRLFLSEKRWYFLNCRCSWWTFPLHSFVSFSGKSKRRLCRKHYTV